MSTPPLGWIEPKDRTQAMNDAHAAATTLMPKFALQAPKLAKGDMVLLTKAWEAPEVVSDCGRKMVRKHQLTGSCVDAGFFQASQSTIATQRVASDSPTQAFVPMTYHNYAMSRHYMGWDSPGEGSLGSTMARSATTDGLRKWEPGVDGMPEYSYDEGDGIITSKSVEMAWSSYHNPNLQRVLAVTRAHLYGAATEAKTPEDVKALVTNGFACTFACNYYVGNAERKGSGDDACVVGKWNGRGGHQQSVHGYWEHPDLGPLFAVGNNWDKSTYPKDSRLPWCFCWVPWDNLQWAMGQDGEVYGLSHLAWFPAQPKVLEIDWMRLGL